MMLSLLLGNVDEEDDDDDDDGDDDEDHDDKIIYGWHRSHFQAFYLLIAKPSAFLSVFSVALASMHTKLLTACTYTPHSHTNRH